MRNRSEIAMLETGFWQKAAASLPAGVRQRYLSDIRHAERIELGLDAAIALGSRAWQALSRPFHPSHAH